MDTTAIFGHLEFLEREWAYETEFLGIMSHSELSRHTSPASCGK
jgi:hypothetical protein